MNLKSSITISVVPFSSKFYGEFESGIRGVDLYRKIMGFDESTNLKWGCLGPLLYALLKGRYKMMAPILAKRKPSPSQRTIETVEILAKENEIMKPDQVQATIDAVQSTTV